MNKSWDYDIPSTDTWKACLRGAKPGAFLLAFGGSRTFHRIACTIEDAGWIIRDTLMWLYGSGFPKSHNISKGIDKQVGAQPTVIGKQQKGSSPLASKHSGEWGDGQVDGIFDVTAPSSEQAKEWEGWGTALKPAFEPIIVAMKPLDGSFADNALKHGVAGLNIDGGRINTEDNLNGGTYAKNSKWEKEDASSFYTPSTGKDFVQPLGRWPANVILDEEAGKMLDAQSGYSKSTSSPRKNSNTGGGFTGSPPKTIETLFTDSGGASRFFYCPKENKKWRNAGCEDLEEQKAGILSGRSDMSLGGTIPRNRNIHPTVKPIPLMEYLCKLTKTPTGGIVLDPFMGSGSTGIAALREGRDFIGIELNPEYFNIAKERIGLVENPIKGTPLDAFITNT